MASTASRRIRTLSVVPVTLSRKAWVAPVASTAVAAMPIEVPEDMAARVRPLSDRIRALLVPARTSSSARAVVLRGERGGGKREGGGTIFAVDCCCCCCCGFVCMYV